MDARLIDRVASPFGETTGWDAVRLVSPTATNVLGLTARETEVLRLLTWRATDREIAELLSISPRTVMHHVSHILAKLGVATRREAGALAAQLRLA